MRSIRARLALGFIVALALFAGGGGAALYWRTKADLERHADLALESRAWALASALHADEGEIQFEPAPALVAEFERADRWAAYEIRGNDGSVFARSSSLGDRELAPPRAIGREAEFAWRDRGGEQRVREIAFTIPIFDEDAAPATTTSAAPAAHAASGESTGSRAASSDASTARAAVTGAAASRASSDEHVVSRRVLDELSITVAEDRADTEATLAGLRATLAGVIALALVLGVLLVHFGLRRGLEPLEAMAADVQNIDAETLEQRLTRAPLPAELEPIRARLNELLDRLQQSFERERRFNAAVAHELRTPIAELRAIAEIALRWPENADLKKNMSDVSAVASEMQSVVEALLKLRRVESGLETVELEPVRVDELVRATIAVYSAAAAAREQSLRVNVAASMTIESHPHMLRSIVSNLVSNAIEYAPKGSTIAIEARIENGRFTFSTKNPAPDLTPDDVLHLFEPFWRKDAVRTTGSHAGLGLTLTESLAKAVGCALHARLESTGVLTIEVEGAPTSVAPSPAAGGSATHSESAKERIEIS